VAAYLPSAIGRKYPGAAKEWKWQYVFPSVERAVDRESGIRRRFPTHDSSVSREIGRAVRASGIQHDDDLHARAEQGRPGGAEPARRVIPFRSEWGRFRYEVRYRDLWKAFLTRRSRNRCAVKVIGEKPAAGTVDAIN
jgi:hypothetical protein